jgi:acyl-CoA synthetase (AMP-forming)/AMP-acid ligase II
MDDVAGLLAALGRRADEAPDQRALTGYRGRTMVAQMTRRELLLRVAGALHHLSTALGVKPGDRIAVLAGNRIEVAILYLAALRLGAALVPLHQNSPPEDWRLGVEHAQACLLVVDPDLMLRLPAMPVAVCQLSEAVPAGPPPRREPPPPGGDALALIIYSASSGLSKGVALSQRSLLASAQVLAETFAGDGGAQLASLPIHHAHTLGFGLTSALVAGCHLVLAERFDPLAFAQVVRAESVAVTSALPSWLPALRAAGLHAAQVPSLQHLLVTSAPLAAEMARQFEEETGIRLLQGWGLAELGGLACCLSPALADEERRSLLFAEPPSVGTPLPGNEVKVIDAHGRPLDADQRGELCVRGPTRMLGYFRDQTATRAAVDDLGWLHTGDEGFFRLHRGEPYLFLTERIKDVIIRGGEKLSPLAIERKLAAALPELDGKLAVVGYPHALHGEEVGVYLETEALEDRLNLALVATLDTLPPDLRPQVVLFGARPIPRTPDGQPERRSLRELFARHAEARGPVHIGPA